MKKQQPLYLIIFGGTFDPIHNGHVALFNKLYDVFQQQIIILPSGTPTSNYKEPSQTTPKQRLEMLNLVFNNDDYKNKFVIDPREINSNEPCNSYKTLSTFRKEVGTDVPIFFLIGSDSLITINSWENWRELFNLTNFIVAQRPNYNFKDTTNKALLDEINNRKSLLKSNSTTIDKTLKSSGVIYPLDITPINISSTNIRSLVRQKQSITHLVPNAVANYITKYNLYL